MTGEQIRGSEVVCAALGAIRAALDAIPEDDLPVDVKVGTTICQIASQLGQHVQTLASVDTPVAQALAEVQESLEGLGHYLQLPYEPEPEPWREKEPS